VGQVPCLVAGGCGVHIGTAVMGDEQRWVGDQLHSIVGYSDKVSLRMLC